MFNTLGLFVCENILYRILKFESLLLTSEHPTGYVLTASLAGEGLLSAVNPLVVMQRGQLLEGPPADRASVRLLVTVVQQMLMVRLLERKCFATNLTRVRHFSCRRKETFVLGQSVDLTELGS